MTATITHSQLAGPTDEPLVLETIGRAFDRTVEKYPDAEALVVRHQGVRWHYKRYQREVDRFACGLLTLGIEPGERVGIWAPNCYEWCVTQFATAKIGAILVCINPAYRLYELEYALNKVQCKAIITAESFKSSNYLGMLRELAPELLTCSAGKLHSARLPYLETVIRMGGRASDGMFNFDSVRTMGGDVEKQWLGDIDSLLDPSDSINIQFTSGTTGRPKGATLTHLNILNNGKLVGDSMRLTEADRVCIPVPLYHCFGMVMGNLACITHGSAAIFPAETFEPKATLEAVAEERCTALYGVPTMFIAELDHPEFGRFNKSSLRTGIMAGSPCPIEVMNRVRGEMQMSEVLIAYGQTETSPVNHITSADDSIEYRVSSVGKPAPHCEIKIIDSVGEVVSVGEEGEVCCRGYCVMSGYWDDDKRTADTIDSDGWLHSGDIGIMDVQGYTKIVGRITDMIIRSGENIYPREVEEFLYTHPEIQEVQIFGIPDQYYGEQVCAWIKSSDNSSLSDENVREFCHNKITHFKVPHHIRFVKDFPMTVTGKIKKFRMRDQMIEELEQGN